MVEMSRTAKKVVFRCLFTEYCNVNAHKVSLIADFVQVSTTKCYISFPISPPVLPRTALSGRFRIVDFDIKNNKIEYSF